MCRRLTPVFARDSVVLYLNIDDEDEDAGQNDM